MFRPTLIKGSGRNIYTQPDTLIRDGPLKSGWSLCRSGADILFDQLIEAGCASKVIFGYLGNPGIGISYAFNRAVREDAISYEDWTNFAMVLRLHAGAGSMPCRGRRFPVKPIETRRRHPDHTSVCHTRLVRRRALEGKGAGVFCFANGEADR